MIPKNAQSFEEIIIEAALKKTVEEHQKSLKMKKDDIVSKDLSKDTTDRSKLLRWSCLPLNCNSEIVTCQGTGYTGNLAANRMKCNKYKCCPKEDVPKAWKEDLDYKNLCSTVQC